MSRFVLQELNPYDKSWEYVKTVSGNIVALIASTRRHVLRTGTPCRMLDIDGNIKASLKLNDNGELFFTSDDDTIGILVRAFNIGKQKSEIVETITAEAESNNSADVREQQDAMVMRNKQIARFKEWIEQRGTLEKASATERVHLIHCTFCDKYFPTSKTRKDVKCPRCNKWGSILEAVV